MYFVKKACASITKQGMLLSTEIIIPYTSEDTYVISVKQLLSELYPLTYDFSSKSEQIQSFLSQSE